MSDRQPGGKGEHVLELAVDSLELGAARLPADAASWRRDEVHPTSA